MIDYINYVILIYLLGITGIIINMYAFLKKDNEYSAQLLSPDQTLTTVEDYFESDEGIKYLRNFIYEYRDRINFILEDKDMLIFNDNKSEVLSSLEEDAPKIFNQNDVNNAVTFNLKKT